MNVMQNNKGNIQAEKQKEVAVTSISVYSEPTKPNNHNDLKGGVVGVSIVVDVDIATEEG